MDRAILVAFAVGALVLAAAPAERAMAMTVAAPSELASAAPINPHPTGALHLRCEMRAAMATTAVLAMGSTARLGRSLDGAAAKFLGKPGALFRACRSMGA